MMPAVLLSLVITGQVDSMVWVHSDSCQACKQMEPIIYRLILEGKPIIISKISTDAEIKKYGSSYVPLTVAYRDGREVARRTGFVNEKDLRALLRSK